MSLARRTSRCILFDGEDFSLMLVLLYTRIHIYIYIYIVYINSTNIPPIMVINRIYEFDAVLTVHRR